MYNHQIIQNDYIPLQKIESKIKWREIAGKYRIKKSFGKVMRHLQNKGYVSDHGKSGEVYSLTSLGVGYAIGKSKDNEST